VRILVTGAAGLIGSAIMYRLLNQGHNAIGLDKKTGVDVRDFFRENERFFDLVIHCAAIVGGRMLVESPVGHAENLEIDAGLFQWAERAKPGRIVYISSVAAYPTVLQHREHELRENEADFYDISAPDELYGWAKLTGEMMAARSGIPVSVPRPFTVYGEGQHPAFPFANLIRQAREHRAPLTVWGSGNQVRDFIHVDDVADGILEMARQDIDGPVNFCTGTGITLRQLAEKIAVTAGFDPAIRLLPDKPEGLLYRVGNPSRLNQFYTPKISLQEGIERGLR
jgi:nucleoside-diphosphate-sugar epimerase